MNIDILHQFKTSFYYLVQHMMTLIINQLLLWQRMGSETIWYYKTFVVFSDCSTSWKLRNIAKKLKKNISSIAFLWLMKLLVKLWSLLEPPILYDYLLVRRILYINFISRRGIFMSWSDGILWPVLDISFIVWIYIKVS